jgi:uncharacterized protein
MGGYLIFMLPALALAGLATLYTRTTFSRYSRYKSVSGMTGAEAARRMLNSQGVDGVAIEQVQGFLSDHYDPRTRTLRLSPAVYGSSSLSAIGVACHEAGHALQHAALYAPLMLRSALVPVTQFGSFASYIFFLLGGFLQSFALIKLGIFLFTLGVLFAVVTLPVEWNASARAKALMTRAGVVSLQEQSMAGAVLNAAFLTYVAAAFTALMQLLYYLMRFGLLGGRRD